MQRTYQITKYIGLGIHLTLGIETVKLVLHLIVGDGVPCNGSAEDLANFGPHIVCEDVTIARGAGYVRELPAFSTVTALFFLGDPFGWSLDTNDVLERIETEMSME
jgi:hypothetical protein